MAEVFVSHASADLATAELLHGWLRADGHQVFLDRDLADGILVGDDWQRRLNQQLRRADAVVCVLTRAFRESAWCAAEIAVAQSRGSLLLPVLAEPGAEHPLLGPVQHADLTVEPDAVRKRLREALRDVDRAGGVGWPDGVSPYPGLRPFDTGQQRVFFGREREVRELTTMLRSPAESAEDAVLLLVGPSGCGKSSLVRAGLVPAAARWSDWWTLEPFLAGAEPVAALAARLADAARALDVRRSPTEIADAVSSGRLLDVVDEILRAAPPPRRRALLVVVDQFEELMSVASADARARFAHALAPALPGPIRVLATVRPEFMAPLLASPDLAVLRTRSYAVRPLGVDALNDVIVRPAEAAGLSVDDGLVARLVTDTAGGDALPLLAYTLAELADGLGRGGRLSESRYDRLGEVRGVLSRQAEAALDAVVAEGGRRREEIVEELLNLVTIDADGLPTRRRVLIATLPDHVARDLEPFVARRLLVTGGDPDRPVIGLAHEAFLSAWSPLQEAVTRAAVALRARRRVEQGAAAWTGSGRRPADLWERGRLAAALADLGTERARTPLRRRLPRAGGDGASSPGHVRSAVQLDADSSAFLRASVRHDRWRRGRSTAVLSVLLVAAIAAAVMAGVQQRAARAAQHATVARTIVAESDRIRGLDPREALRLGLAALAVDPTPGTRAALLQTLAASRYRGTIDATPPGQPGPVVNPAAALSPDGRYLATAAAGRIDLWNVTSPGAATKLGEPLTAPSPETRRLAFVGGGTRLLVADGETLVAWDVANPERAVALGTLRSTAPVLDVAVMPDDSRFVTLHPGGQLQMWQLTDASPRQLGTLVAADGQDVQEAIPLGTGGRVAVLAPDGILLWDWADPARPTRLGAVSLDKIFARSAAISADGNLLAVNLRSGNEIQLWDIRDPRAPTSIGEPFHRDSAVTALSFSPDGGTLASTHYDGTAVLWDVRRPDEVFSDESPLTGHRAPVWALCFSADGRFLLTSGDDGAVLVWAATDAAAPQRVGPDLVGHEGYVEALALSGDGRLLATGGEDATVRLWDLTDAARPVPLPTVLHGEAKVATVDISRDGRLLAVGGTDESLSLWELTDRAHPTRLPFTLPGNDDVTALHPTVRLAGDGDLLAVADRSTVVLLDVSDPRSPRRIGAPIDNGRGVVTTLGFSPDGTRLAIGSADRAARVYDVVDPRRPRLVGAPLGGQGEEISSIAFNPAGTVLATASRDVLTLWDVSGESPGVVGGLLTTDAGDVTALSFSADGTTLLAGSLHGIAVWDVSDRNQPRPLDFPARQYDDIVAFVATPGGLGVTTALASRSAEVWDLSFLTALRDGLVREACARSGGMVDARQWDVLAPGIDAVDLCGAG